MWYRGDIDVIAPQFGLDPALVEAIVLVESAGKTHAYRYEPDFWRRYLADKVEWKDQNPERVSASYGLMQVMYSTAWECGFREEPECLFVPSIGLRWGCTYLSRLMEWAHQDPAKAVAAYNGGRGAWSKAPAQTYREKVYAHWHPGPERTGVPV